MKKSVFGQLGNGMLQVFDKEKIYQLNLLVKLVNEVKLINLFLSVNLVHAAGLLIFVLIYQILSIDHYPQQKPTDSFYIFSQKPFWSSSKSH